MSGATAIKESTMRERNKDDKTQETANQKTAEKSAHFLISNVLSISIAVVTTLISAFAIPGTERVFDLTISPIDLIVSVLVLNCIYVATSYGLSKFGKTSGLMKLVFRIPSWLELRNFGDHRVARVSYIALVIIPVSAYFVVDNPLRLEILNDAALPVNGKISFFVSFFLSVALIIFAVGCPKEFHRKSPFEGAKTVNIVLNSVTETVVKVNEESENFDTILDESKLEFRAFCWLFYTLGLLLSVVLLIRAALYVMHA